MAIISPIFKILSQSQRNLSSNRDEMRNINRTLSNRQKFKRDYYAQTNFLRGRREEDERRQQLEDELEAPTVVTQSTGPAQLAQKSTSKGWFDRILGFIGYLSAGWIMNNLPTWIGMGEEFLARIKVAGEITSGFFNDTVKLFTGFGNLLSAAGENLLRFDFLDTSNRIKNALGDLNSTVGDMGSKLEQALGLVSTPLTEGKYSGKDIPKLGTEQTDKGAYAEPPPDNGGENETTISGKMTDNQRQALNILSKYESASSGGYNAVNQIGVSGGRGVLPGSFSGDFRNMKQHKGRALTDMTIAEIMSLQAERPGMSNQEWVNQGRLHAVGRYQFIGTTLPGVVKRSGIPTSVKFSPEVQDLLALQLLKEGGIGQWVGPSDRATSQERVIIEQARREPINFKASISTGTSQPQSNQQSLVSTTVVDQFKGKPGGSAGVVTSERGMRLSPKTGRYRMHEGIDIAPAGPGYYVALKISGKVDFVGWDAGGYGNFVDIKSGNTIYRFGHLAKVMVRLGQPYNGQTIGEIGSTGGSTGIHLHYEVRPGGGNSIDPRPYINLLSIGKQLSGLPGQQIQGSTQTPLPSQSITTTLAQISPPASPQGQITPFSITPERRGPDIIIAQPRNQQQTIVTSSSEGQSPQGSSISDIDLLNNFIKNKLLLDLAYL
jgi:murein DD-endopeptidase MepM/ murein hydrolase activator NlpD